jgi:lipoprotein-releasing system permease protein
MNLSFYIARRYLLAKKSHNAINIISAISVVGVAVGSTALIVILSVFNGFDGLLKKLYGTFYSELQIVVNEGKTFKTDTAFINRIKRNENVLYVAEVLEENALLKYGDKQYIARIKGVSDNYEKITGIDSMISEGKFMLKKDGYPYAVVGNGVAYYLSIGLNFINPIFIYIPNRKASNMMLDPLNAFKNEHVFPSGFFSIQNDFDTKYVFLPLDFVRKLLNYTTEVSALELKLKPGSDSKKVEMDLKRIVGNNYSVLDRYEQNKLFFRVMKGEKWAIYMILTFILIVASFNIIGSLTMLIIEKEKDIFTLESLGANNALIRKIFFTEGWLISIVGLIIGLIAGTLICWAQYKFELLKLQGSGSFIISAYPVEMRPSDFFLVSGIVIFIGIIAAIIPAYYITKRNQTNL